MTISWEYTRQEFAAVFRRTVLRHRGVQVFMAFLVAAGVISALAWRETGEVGRLIAMIASCTILVLWLIYSLWLAPLLRYRELQRAGPVQSVRVSDDGLSYSSPALVQEFGWDQVSEVKPVGRSYDIHLPHGIFLSVPLRAFQSDRERAAFVETVREHVRSASI